MAPQTTLAPYFDAEELFGSGFTTPQTVSAPFLDSGFGFGSGVTIGTPTPGLTVFNGATELDESFARSWQDELPGAGSFRISVANDDADMPDFDDVLRFNLDEQPAFAGLVEAKRITTYSSGEEVDEVTVVSGRGSLALTDYATVETSRGLDSLPVEVVRSFAWPATDYDDSEWAATKRTQTPSQAGPEWWPDFDAWWVWANRTDVSATSAPGGRCLFRQTFTLASSARLRIFIGLDNFGSAYFDGVKIIDTEDEGSYRYGQYVEVPEASTGDHVLALSCLNTGGHGGVIYTVWTVDEGGLLDTLITHSDANTTLCLPYPYPNNMPGFTAGEAIRIAVEEAQTRDEMVGVALDFSDTLDSDGEPWTEVAEITIEVGRTVYEFLEELSDWLIDVQMAPGANLLRAWNWGTRGGTPGVTVAATADPETSEVEALVHDGRLVRANRLLIRYRGGWTTVEDAASITANGQRSAYVDLGHVESETAAKRVGAKLLTLRKDANYAHTLTLSPVSSTPYAAFDLGDYITHPDETGSTSASRARSFTVTEDEDGQITYVVELHDVRREAQERHDNWLKRFNAGGLSGGAKVTSRSGEALGAASRLVSKNVAEFSYDNSVLTASYSPKRPADSSGNLIEIYAELTTPGSTATTVRVYKNGLQLGADLTFAAGVTSADVDLSAEKTYRNDDIYQTRIVTPGAGAQGLDVQVRAI